MKKLFVPVFLLMVLASCGGGGTVTVASGNGKLVVVVRDSPTDSFSHINVTISGVRVHMSADAGPEDTGWHDLMLPEPLKVDLLSLRNGAPQELGQLVLDAGQYQQIRLLLVPNSEDSPFSDSVVPVAGLGAGIEMPLDTAPEDVNGIKIIHQFTVNEDTVADLVLDFDGNNSVVMNGDGTYSLEPVISASVTPQNQGI